MLSFETEAMSREEIALASYQVAGELNELKYKNGLIDVGTYTAVSHSLTAAEAVLAEIDRAAGLPVDKRAAALAMIRTQIQTANGAALCGVDELKWPLSQRFHLGGTLARGLAAGLLREFRHTAARLVGHYDGAPFQGERVQPFEVSD
jgi:hypothetical protein